MSKKKIIFIVVFLIIVFFVVNLWITQLSNDRHNPIAPFPNQTGEITEITVNGEIITVEKFDDKYLFQGDIMVRPDPYEKCESSEECFVKNVESCTPATSTYADDPELRYTQTVEGKKDNNCILTLTYEKTETTSSLGLEGKSMTCRVPESDLSNFKNYLTGKEKMLEACEGSLLDLLLKLESTQ